MAVYRGTTPTFTAGEVNTNSNAGAGEGLVNTKVGVNTPIKTISAGANVVLNSTGDNIEIEASGGSGEVNTNSNAGAGAQIAQSKSGVDTPLRTLVSSDSSVVITQNADEVDLQISQEIVPGDAIDVTSARLSTATPTDAQGHVTRTNLVFTNTAFQATGDNENIFVVPAGVTQVRITVAMNKLSGTSQSYELDIDIYKNGALAGSNSDSKIRSSMGTTGGTPEISTVGTVHINVSGGDLISVKTSKLSTQINGFNMSIQAVSTVAAGTLPHMTFANVESSTTPVLTGGNYLVQRAAITYNGSRWATTSGPAEDIFTVPVGVTLVRLTLKGTIEPPTVSAARWLLILVNNSQTYPGSNVDLNLAVLDKFTGGLYQIVTGGDIVIPVVAGDKLQVRTTDASPIADMQVTIEDISLTAGGAQAVNRLHQTGGTFTSGNQVIRTNMTALGGLMAGVGVPQNIFTIPAGVSQVQVSVGIQMNSSAGTTNDISIRKNTGLAIIDIPMCIKSTSDSEKYTDFKTGVIDVIQGDNITSLFGGTTGSGLNGLVYTIEQVDNVTSTAPGSTAPSGEANTNSNAGTGEGLVLPKVGVDTPIKSLVGGAGITLTQVGDTIEISVT
jgi:hypothetical protein